MGVGEKRKNILRKYGIKTRRDILDRGISSLEDIDGIGRKTAREIYDSAKAIEKEKIINNSSKPIPPNHTPIFIDIETDDINANIAWLIGVYDKDEEEYMDFIQKNPDNQGKAVEEFISWYSKNKLDRPVAAYRGIEFDFKVLTEQIQKHCSNDLIEAWNRAYKFDPYRWVKQNKIILPGLTDKLKDVTDALGYERENSFLNGRAVGRIYKNWMQERKNNPDWETLKIYCRDDVESLVYLYEKLEETIDVIAKTNHKKSTTQKTFSDL